MDLSSNKLPNKMLTGDELLEIAVKEFREMLRRDWYFSKTIAYRRVAFTLQGTFHFGYPNPSDVIVKSRTKAQEVVEGEVPLTDLPEDESDMVSLERDVVLDNPNIARIQHDMPIVVQERKMPSAVPVDGGIPGETPAALTNPFPAIETHHLKYDKTQYPKGPEPVDRDVSAEVAASSSMKRRNKG